MSIWKKILITGVIVFGGSKLASAATAFKVSNEMTVKLLNPRVHKLDPNPLTGGLELRTEVELSNPTKGTMRITQPHIQILSHGNVISSSKVSKASFLLKPFSTVKINTISLKLDWTNIINTIAFQEYGIPTEGKFMQKVTFVLKNYKTIIDKMGLAFRYTTYANGNFYTETQNIRF
jgi:hypothetical protein